MNATSSFSVRIVPQTGITMPKASAVAQEGIEHADAVSIEGIKLFVVR